MPGKWLYDIYRYRILSEEAFIKQTFKYRFGYALDLKNPKTLNEKIQWLKLNDRTSLQALCADKYAVRGYIKDKIGAEYLIPLVYQTQNPVEIVPENIPDFPCIIKANHTSGGAIIVKTKDEVDWKKTRKELAKLLKKNFYYRGREWQYRKIEPRILVEKLLLDENLAIPMDYKLHCFNGKLVFIQVDIDRHTNHKRNIYNTDWNLLDCCWKYSNETKRDIKKPALFEAMRSLAEAIAQDFCYVRVDLYQVGNKIYFGELTFHSESGFALFIPPEWDRRLGEQLTLVH